MVQQTEPEPQVALPTQVQQHSRCSRRTCHIGLLDIELQARGVAEQEGLVAGLVTLPAEEEHLILYMGHAAGDC